MTPDPTAPALFVPEPPAAGPLSAAMAAQLREWAAAGIVVPTIAAATLGAQARAVDLATAAGRPTNVSGATRVLLELLIGFGLTGSAVPPPSDAFDQLVADLEKASAEAGAPPPPSE